MSKLEDLLLFQIRAMGLPEPEREYRAIKGRMFRFDFAWTEPNHKLLVEVNGGTYNGGTHGRGCGINRDYEKGNLAVVHNWRVLSFDTKQVKSGAALEVVEKLIGGEFIGKEVQE